MKSRQTRQLLLMALVLGATALATETTPAAATEVIVTRHLGTAPPRVMFSTAPRWELIPGTGVALVIADQRPSYDLFRYGSRYYAYDNGYWYRSSRLDRRFVAIEERYVPIQIAGVPNERWRSYPAGWMNPKNPHYAGRHDNGNHARHGRGGKKR
jgi:hypothetical protein